MSLTFKQLRDANAERVAIWHPKGMDDWSVSDWSVAMAGEAGEVCNAVKKLRRVQDALPNISEDATRQLSSVQEAHQKIGDEIADTLIYLDLLAQRIGLSLEDVVRAKFNRTSALYKLPVTL